MDERRSPERRDDHRDAHRRGERPFRERPRRQSLVTTPAVRRVFPIAEADGSGRVSSRYGRQRMLLAIADGVAVACAIVVAVAASAADLTVAGVLGGVVLTVVLASVTGLYSRDQLLLRRSTLDEAPRLLELSAFMALTYWLVFGSQLNRGGLLVLWGMLFVALALARLSARLIGRILLKPERCLFIGDMTVADDFRDKINGSRANAVVVGAIGLEAGQTGDDIGGVEGLRRIVRRAEVDRVVIAPVSTVAADTLELIRIAKLACTQVTIFPRLFEVIGSAVEFEDVEGLTLIGVRRFGLSKGSHALKRLFDVALGVLITLIALPLMALIAVVIRLESSGPILFRQLRVGRDGRHFKILKFRTMVPDAELLKAGLRPLNETEGLFKITDDPRITRVGKVLRKLSFDELPQLFNVLRGDMSLVGPRPLVIDEDEQVLGLDRSRLHLTPGMTGPWQVLRSGRVPMHEMVSMDYLYVANWSLWTDFKLLLRTVSYVLARGGM